MMRLSCLVIAGALALAAGPPAGAVQAQPAPAQTGQTRAEPAQAGAPAAKFYITRFCAAVALNDVEPALLRQLYSDWGAHSVGDERAQTFRPDEPETSGQMAEFADKAAPKVFIDGRRGTCSLIYTEAHPPQAVTDEFRNATLTLHKDARPAVWGRLASKRLGGRGPIRYFLPTSDDGRFGLCAVIYEDLRLHDGAPATQVRVATCRLSEDETYDNG